MIYIVAYDVQKNSTRSKLARYLKGKGNRLQKSVFAVDLEGVTAKRLMKDIRRIVDEDDQVAVFRQCKGCTEKAMQLKDSEPPFLIF